MLKRVILLLLCVSLLLVPGMAAGTEPEFQFTLQAEGEGECTAEVGDEITVSFLLRRTDSSEDWAMYAWQTEIVYDSAAFSLVEGSVHTPDGVTSSLHPGAESAKVYFNDFSLRSSGEMCPAEMEVCSFRLRVLSGGEHTIRNTNCRVSKAGGQGSYRVEAQDLRVSVEGGANFTDVPPDAWYADAVAFVVKRGLFLGTGENRFSPHMDMNRGMLVTVLWRLAGKPECAGETRFTDVPAGAWYAEAVAWASENGIVSGYGSGLFGPGDPVTREQMATILLRYSALMGYDVAITASLEGYSDLEAVSLWALDAVKWANAGGIILGTSDTTLSPGSSASRAQVATMLLRFVERFEEE